MNIRQIIKESFTIIKKEDLDALFSILKKDSIMNIPTDEKIIGRQNINEYILKQKEWLKENNATVEIFNTIDTSNRLIIEFIVKINFENKLTELPIAVVIEIEKNQVSNI